MTHPKPGAVSLLLLVLVAACSPEPVARPVGATVGIDAPLGLPAVPWPDDNPPTAETIELGRKLFFDTALSADNTVSCATCHEEERAFVDGKRFSEGIGGQRGARNAPTVLNAVYFETQFHDGRVATLEEQVSDPVTNPVEMGSTLAGAVAAVAGKSEYVAAFERAFGPGEVTFEKIAKAIAAYERTLVSGNSPFDRFRFGKDETALSEAARRGWEVFRDPERGNCTICHLVGAHTAPLTDNLFHNIGVGVDADGVITDLGRYIVSNRDADQGAFKTPSLRNVALTAPYMHDGSLATLGEVLDFYAVGGRPNPYLDAEMKPVALSAEDRADLIAFLEALTGSRSEGGGSGGGWPDGRLKLGCGWRHGRAGGRATLGRPGWDWELVVSWVKEPFVRDPVGAGLLRRLRVGPTVSAPRWGATGRGLYTQRSYEASTGWCGSVLCGRIRGGSPD